MAGRRGPEKAAASAKAPQPKEDDGDPLDDMSDLELAAYVAANPFAHLTHRNTRRLFQIGEKTMRAIVELKPPSVARKFNPSHFQRWLWINRQVVEKLNG